MSFVFDCIALPFNAVGYVARWVCFEILMGWNIRADQEVRR